MSNDLFSELEKEHAQIRSLLGRMSFLTESASNRRLMLFGKLRSLLLPHLRTEEQVLYPCIEAIEDLRQDAFEAAEQHHLIQIIIDELETTPAESPRWGAKLALVRELIDRHTGEEEDRVFDDIREIMTREELECVFRRYVETSRAISQSMETLVVS